MYSAMALRRASRSIVSKTSSFNGLKVSKVGATYAQQRFISENSFAAEILKEQGETLEARSTEEQIFVTDELIDNPSDKVKRLAEEVLELNVVEVNSMFKILQTRLGMTDASFAMGGGGGGGGEVAETAAAAPAEPEKPKDSFDLKLASFGPTSKIKVIKEVRSITGLGLKEAKELVEKAPTVLKAGITKADADTFKKAIEEAGGVIELL